jgi:hypothetical protein
VRDNSWAMIDLIMGIALSSVDVYAIELVSCIVW